MKYLEKFEEDLKQFKRNQLCELSKTCRNSRKNEKNLTSYHKNTSMITQSLSIQFFDSNTPRKDNKSQ